MQEIIKRVELQDYDFILELNKRNVNFLLPMDEAQLAFLVKAAKMFHVLYADGIPVAFLIAMQGGLPDYDIKVYRWFSSHYKNILYIDRVVTDEKYRGMGFGQKLYRDMFDRARREGINAVAAAIETVPYNEQSLTFHKRMGFYQVDELSIRDDSVKVSLQIADVPKFTDKDHAE